MYVVSSAMLKQGWHDSSNVKTCSVILNLFQNRIVKVEKVLFLDTILNGLLPKSQLKITRNDIFYKIAKGKEPTIIINK